MDLKTAQYQVIGKAHVCQLHRRVEFESRIFTHSRQILHANNKKKEGGTRACLRPLFEAKKPFGDPFTNKENFGVEGHYPGNPKACSISFTKSHSIVRFSHVKLQHTTRLDCFPAIMSYKILTNHDVMDE